MIRRRKRRVSDRSKILASFSVKKRKALKCDPRLISCIKSIKHKIEELVTIKRFVFPGLTSAVCIDSEQLDNPREVANNER